MDQNEAQQSEIQSMHDSLLDYRIHAEGLTSLNLLNATQGNNMDLREYLFSTYFCSHISAHN